MLTTEKLAERWGLDKRTLENWRARGEGPQYLKFGNQRQSHVVYRLSDVEKYEKDHLVKP